MNNVPCHVRMSFSSTTAPCGTRASRFNKEQQKTKKNGQRRKRRKRKKGRQEERKKNPRTETRAVQTHGIKARDKHRVAHAVIKQKQQAKAASKGSKQSAVNR